MNISKVSSSMAIPDQMDQTSLGSQEVQGKYSSPWEMKCQQMELFQFSHTSMCQGREEAEVHICSKLVGGQTYPQENGVGQWTFSHRASVQLMTPRHVNYLKMKFMKFGIFKQHVLMLIDEL